MAQVSKNKEAAWKLIKHLLDTQTNGFIASSVFAFPGNINAKPDFVEGDPLYAQAFEIYRNSNPINEFWGPPNSVNLQRVLLEQLQSVLEKKQTVDQAVKNAQEGWLKEYN
jgi:multiple sugar transport system substrate-binding protein